MSFIREVGVFFDGAQRAILKYTRNSPGLRWGQNDRDGVYSSGWSPLKGVNICFRDESRLNNRMWFVIELPAPGMALKAMSIGMAPSFPITHGELTSNAMAIGYFFDRNPETGKVDCLYRLKPFRGKEHAVLYRDCCYFGMETEKIYTSVTKRELYTEESKFVISNDWQDKALGTGVNFCRSKYSDFAYIVELINDFIQQAKVEAHIVPDISKAYPVLKLVKSLDEVDTDVSDDDDEEGPQRDFLSSEDCVPMAVVTSREGYYENSMNSSSERNPTSQRYVVAAEAHIIVPPLPLNHIYV